jgi:hypothetical protein
MFTVAPAGIETPFVPVIDSVVVAVTLSPIALVFVQTRADEARASVVPAAMVPVRAAAGVGAGVVLVGVEAVFVGVVFVLVVFEPVGRGAEVTGGAFVVAPAGEVAVSLSVMFALSRPARARFAASAESFFRAVESVFAASPEQPASVIAARAKDVAVMRV